MARFVMDIKEETKIMLFKQAKKLKKSAKDYVLWSTGLICIERGNEKN